MIDRRIQVLRVVAERGTVTAAAAALSYTPSAVSHQLRTLARDLEVTLLEPSGRGIRLTAAAHLLLRRSDELSARWEEVRGELVQAGGRAGSMLRLCGFSTAAAALLPSAAAAVTGRFPHCTVRIIEADPQECFDLLLAEQADVAVAVATGALPPNDDLRFDQRPLLDDPLDLLVHDQHRLATLESVHLTDAADEPWILDRPGRPHHGLVRTACAQAGFTPRIAHEAAEWQTGAALVGAGLGVALVPRLARLPDGYDIVRVPLRGEPAPSRHVLTGVRRGSRAQPLVATALAALHEAAEA